MLQKYYFAQFIIDKPTALVYNVVTGRKWINIGYPELACYVVKYNNLGGISMKRFISIVSAFAMLSAVPMSSYAADSDEENSVRLDVLVDTILEDISLYDFNADGVTDFNDPYVAMVIYADAAVQNICINDDRTYSLTEYNDNPFDEYTEETLIRVLATGNITNPEWNPERKHGSAPDAAMDKIDAIDASLLLTALNEYYSDGDVNADGAVDSLDASSVLSCYAAFQTGEYPEMSPESLGIQCLGDYNADGAIDALDASDILAGYAAAQTA